MNIMYTDMNMAFNNLDDMSTSSSYSANKVNFQNIKAKKVMNKNIKYDKLSTYSSDCSDDSKINNNINYKVNSKINDKINSSKCRDDYSNNILDPNINKIGYYTHKMYANEFINSLQGVETFSSGANNFDHVKGCDICRDIIKRKMKKNVVEEFSVKESKNKIMSTLSNSENKYVLLIVLLGLILIVIVDLFVRIGRRSTQF